VLPQRLSDCLAWYASEEEPATSPDVCASRDVFQARLDSALRELLALGWVDDEAALLIAVLGEIGNNSFDHNLGQWRDVPGCWFGREPSSDPSLFWVADRGVGLLATLKRADPALDTPEQAMDAAFLRVLSGRAPERRGNGLKFVRSVVNDDDRRALVCQSEGARTQMGGLVSSLSVVGAALASIGAPGVISVVAWRSE
jgi:hypothetical protein